MCQGSELRPGTSIYSQNHNFRVAFQFDGNLVIYDAYENIVKDWLTDGDRWIFQDDGNLVLFKGKIPQKATMTFGEKFILVMQNDGNLEMFNAGHKSIWSTNTHHENQPANIPVSVALSVCNTVAPTLAPTKSPLANPSHMVITIYFIFLNLILPFFKNVQIN